MHRIFAFHLFLIDVLIFVCKCLCLFFYCPVWEGSSVWDLPIDTAAQGPALEQLQQLEKAKAAKVRNCFVFNKLCSSSPWKTSSSLNFMLLCSIFEIFTENPTVIKCIIETCDEILVDYCL